VTDGKRSRRSYVRPYNGDRCVLSQPCELDETTHVDEPYMYLVTSACDYLFHGRADLPSTAVNSLNTKIQPPIRYDTIRYETIYLRALKSWWYGQLSLAHGTETKKGKTKNKNRLAQKKRCEARLSCTVRFFVVVNWYHVMMMMMKLYELDACLEFHELYWWGLYKVQRTAENILLNNRNYNCAVLKYTVICASWSKSKK